MLEELETTCHQNMARAIETQEGLGIEYDEDVVCDVCRSPEGEDGNEMVFCDKCNVCVHQVGSPLSLRPVSDATSCAAPVWAGPRLGCSPGCRAAAALWAQAPKKEGRGQIGSA